MIRLRFKLQTKERFIGSIDWLFVYLLTQHLFALPEYVAVLIAALGISRMTSVLID